MGWASPQDWEVGDLSDAHHRVPLLRKLSRIRIAPQNFLRTLLDCGVQPRRLPVPSAMGAQFEVAQNSANRLALIARMIWRFTA